jgi:hypothetical protein
LGAPELGVKSAEPEPGTLKQSVLGCDFASSPNRKKPIVFAWGALQGKRVTLESLERFESLAAYSERLHQPDTWVGAFDFPFGLPRELVLQLGWPQSWAQGMRHYASLSRQEIRTTFAAFCAARPAGTKFAHRATDRVAGSSSSMKWVNPPVAYMLHAGVPALMDAAIHLPGLQSGGPANLTRAGQYQRVALEGYPGMLAREVLARRSYKSDEKPKQNHDRLIARKDLIAAMELGQTRLGLRLKLTHAQRDALTQDATADSLDAVLCMMQAAWACQQGAPGYGLPAGFDSLEGWIITA